MDNIYAFLETLKGTPPTLEQSGESFEDWFREDLEFIGRTV